MKLIVLFTVSNYLILDDFSLNFKTLNFEHKPQMIKSKTIVYLLFILHMTSCNLKLNKTKFKISKFFAKITNILVRENYIADTIIFNFLLKRCFLR